MNRKQKKVLIRIIAAAALMAALKIFTSYVELNAVFLFVLWMIPYITIGYDILKKAFKGIVNR